MPGKAEAVRAIHAPHDAAEAAAARRRLIFEELYILQLGIFLLRSHGRRAAGAPMHPLDMGPFWRSLPYAPTGAQRRAAQEITQDLCGKTPMNRLLQGDVGSGKTLVAAAAIWFAAQNGWQSALLAPTEILARQHAATLADRLEPFGVNVTLLVGGMKAAERRVALAAIADGRAGLVVGTHAVLTDQVVFKNLGLAIVDEQHRFGVRQRGLLAGKAQSPHLLVMSATPIPRTLTATWTSACWTSCPPAANRSKPGLSPAKSAGTCTAFWISRSPPGIRSISSARPLKKMNWTPG